MVTGTQALLTGIISTVAVVAMLGLTVYPFDYGVVESAVLAGAFVLVRRAVSDRP